jgi:hypothetical protein
MASKEAARRTKEIRRAMMTQCGSLRKRPRNLKTRKQGIRRQPRVQGERTEISRAKCLKCEQKVEWLVAAILVLNIYPSSFPAQICVNHKNFLPSLGIAHIMEEHNRISVQMKLAGMRLHRCHVHSSSSLWLVAEVFHLPTCKEPSLGLFENYCQIAAL